MNAEEALLEPGFQVDADLEHVSQELGRGFLEREDQAAFSTLTRGVGELGRPGLSCPCPRYPRRVRCYPVGSPCRRTSCPRAATPVETRSSPAGWSRDADVIGTTEMPSSSIRNGNSLVSVRRSPILDDPEAASGDLIGHAMVEEDHAVGNVFLKPVSSNGRLAALTRDDGCHTLVFEPSKQSTDLRPQDRGVCETAEERLDRVEDDPLGPDRIDGESEADDSLRGRTRLFPGSRFVRYGCSRYRAFLRATRSFKS